MAWRYISITLLLFCLANYIWWRRSIAGENHVNEIYGLKTEESIPMIHFLLPKANKAHRKAVYVDDPVFTPSKPLQDSIPLEPRQRALAIAEQFVTNKMNIFFDEEYFLERALAGNDLLVEDIVKLLTNSLDDPPNLELGQSPKEVLKRMAAIDLLERIAETKPYEDATDASVAALENIVTYNLSESISGTTKQAMVGEKIDALAALVRISPTRAFDVFVRIKNPNQKDILTHALRLGLVDRGVPKREVEDELNRLIVAAVKESETSQ